MLFFAVNNGDLKKVKELLAKGVNVNRICGRYTILMFAILRDHLGDLRIIKELLKYPSIKVNQRNNKGLTALALAVDRNRLGAAKELMKQKI